MTLYPYVLMITLSSYMVVVLGEEMGGLGFLLLIVIQSGKCYALGGFLIKLWTIRVLKAQP